MWPLQTGNDREAFRLASPGSIVGGGQNSCLGSAGVEGFLG